LCQPVQRIVALSHGAYESTEGVNLVLTGVTAVLIDFGDGKLYTGMVLGFDDAVGRAALAGDVAAKRWDIRNDSEGIGEALVTGAEKKLTDLRVLPCRFP
jgi:hypothetical protein